MPIISSFFGILIKMYFEEHNPPHFHAEYQGNGAIFLISNGDVIKTKNFPTKAIKLISEWAIENQKELYENWERMEKNQSLLKIKGADQ